jgi:mannose-6-phosphate isomerase
MFDVKKIESFDSKSKVFDYVRGILIGLNFEIIREDMERPWGGFFAIREDQLIPFKDIFFPELELDSHQLNQKLSPKILIVEANKRLSWQYHHRRAEVWKLVAGSGRICTSTTDELGEDRALIIGDIVKLYQGERHRLIGDDSWGLVAEIWLHTDPNFPSDENDIVRVEDDFFRK